MKKTKLYTLTALTILLITSLIAPSAFATTVPTFTLSATSAQIPITLPQGTTFNGSISATGTVRFWVSAPNGAIIVNLGLIDNPTTFGFVAQQKGNYTLNFENDLFNSIQVSFSYTTNPDISENNNSAGIPFSYLPITIVIGVVGIILIVFLIHRKNKNLASTQTH